IDILLENFDIRNERLFDLFDIVCRLLLEKKKTELEMLKKRFAEQMERKEILIRREIMERLEKDGISGDGLDLNVGAWTEWEAGLKEIQTVFKDRFAEWKKKLVKS
ncbi:MAG TPA: hypothetical protein PLF87_04455, partial [Syntrophorhabdaceae bacterium]|nr:hypothetical protein [Syntrophorhabdaceae bacterium]